MRLEKRFSPDITVPTSETIVFPSYSISEGGELKRYDWNDVLKDLRAYMKSINTLGIDAYGLHGALGALADLFGEVSLVLEHIEKFRKTAESEASRHVKEAARKRVWELGRVLDEIQEFEEEYFKRILNFFKKAQPWLEKSYPSLDFNVDAFEEEVAKIQKDINKVKSIQKRLPGADGKKLIRLNKELTGNFMSRVPVSLEEINDAKENLGFRLQGLAQILEKEKQEIIGSVGREILGEVINTEEQRYAKNRTKPMPLSPDLFG